jgi:hypothetical protein
MAAQKSGGRKKDKGGSKKSAGAFDKKVAVRTVEVPVAGPGVYSFGDDVTAADRVWVEWVPSAALEGKARRAFLSKKGIVDPAIILTDGGIQVARKGWSGSMDGRVAIVFGPGKFKIWVAAEVQAVTARAGARELPSQLLQLVAPGGASSNARRESAAALSETQRRRV